MKDFEGGAQGSPRWPKGIPWAPQDAPKRAKATPKDGQREHEGAPKGAKKSPRALLRGQREAKDASRDKHYIHKLPIIRIAAVM